MDNYNKNSCAYFKLVIEKTYKTIDFKQLFNYLSESKIMKPIFNNIKTNDFNDSTLNAVLIIYMIYYIFFSVTKNIGKKEMFLEKIEAVLEDTKKSQYYYDELGAEISRLVKEEIQFKPYDNSVSRSKRSGNQNVTKSAYPGATGRNPSRAALIGRSARLRQQSKSSDSKGGSPKTRKKKFRKNKLETHL
jgi:hypothetical protein